MTPYRVEIQTTYSKPLPVGKKSIKNWVSLVLENLPAAEVTLRFVNIDEITNLNNKYRNKNSPTNILAFPSSIPKAFQDKRPFLGDLVIAPEILLQEHLILKLKLEAHWAHIIIHGTLHLLGYTHEDVKDTQEMQNLEKMYLAKLNFLNPYKQEQHNLE
ncbi:MAG: rRNA maturation RNase YbeY [Legionellales bacterium RIFCSPHIGHO2_12_FULL_37_14]|nr:MAG: rRNA maturation RNase YbeY [Legionellales bacterium RIFCSPHIGHO2_12_FULL_37_14]